MCQELSALHILIHLILLTIAKMRYYTLAPFLDWLMNSELVTCPKSPSTKLANLGLPSRIWELGFSIAPGIPVTFGYAFAYITFSPRSSEMQSLPYKLSTTQVFLSHISNEISVALSQGHHLADITAFIPQADKEGDVKDPFCQTEKNQCSCMHPAS